MFQKSILLLLSPAVFQAGLASVCDEAFKEGCYQEEPFQYCCDLQTCRPHSNVVCNWEFFTPCCEPLSGTFNVSTPDCLKACQMLGSQKFDYTDYCPDGALWYQISFCPSAHASLQNAVTLSTEKNKWCTSKKEVTCKWSFLSYQGGVSSQGKGFGGSFSYTDDEDHYCRDACASLQDPGSFGMADYCDSTSPLHQRLTRCDPLKNQLIEKCRGSHGSSITTELVGHGFKAGVVEVPVSPRPRRLGEGTQCRAAFNSGCYKEKPFTTCCQGCTNTTVEISCGVEKAIEGYKPWRFDWKTKGNREQAFKCTASCNELNTAKACDVCTAIDHVKSKCPFANQIAKPSWCDTDVCSDGLSAVSPSSYAVGQMPAAMVGTFALVALVVGAVAVRNHRSAREESYVPFNDESTLAGRSM